jgi:hypothetical protein
VILLSSGPLRLRPMNRRKLKDMRKSRDLSEPEMQGRGEDSLRRGKRPIYMLQPDAPWEPLVLSEPAAISGKEVIRRAHDLDAMVGATHTEMDPMKY